MTLGIDPYGATPGQRDKRESTEKHIMKAGEGFKGYFMLSSDVKFASTNTDTGNTGDTNTLRAGNLIGTETSLGNEYIYSAAATDGTQTAWGILPRYLNMQEYGTAVDKPMVGLLTHGVYRRSEIIGMDAQAESQLAMRGLFPDDAPTGAAALVHPVGTYRATAASTTLTAADNGKLYVASNAADQTFILPTIAAGLSFQFIRTVAKDLVLDGASNIIGIGSVTHDKVTFADAIGSHVRILAIYDTSTTLKWIVEVLDGTAVYS